MKIDLLKRLRRAWKAFMTEDKPLLPIVQPRAESTASQGPKPLSINELLDMFDKANKNGGPMNPIELYNMKSQASEIAKKAHLEQNDQINRYTDKVIEKNIDPMILAIYKDSGSTIPGLETNVSMFIDPIGANFGRRILIRLYGKMIGDAVFMASFTNGVTSLKVDERIKV